MYDFAETPGKGFYIIEHRDKPEFTWVELEPMHIMKQSVVTSDRRRSPEWYSMQVKSEVESFLKTLRASEKSGYLRIRLEGDLSEGFPNDIALDIPEDPLLLWVDVDTMKMELPALTIRPQRDHIDVKDYFSVFGDFAEDIREMHVMVGDALEEDASSSTGLLKSTQRVPYINEWVKRFESHQFKEPSE